MNTEENLNHDYQKCLEKTIDYLSRRDHSAKELRDKLIKKKFSKDVINQSIDWVSNRGYLRPPDELSTLLTEMLIQKGKGRHYIIQYLKKRGLPTPEDISQPEEELQLALELAQKIIKQLNLSENETIDRKIKEKIGRKLASRGFPLDIIRKVIFEKL